VNTETREHFIHKIHFLIQTFVQFLEQLVVESHIYKCIVKILT